MTLSKNPDKCKHKANESGATGVAGCEALIRQAYALLPHVKVTDLLLEVDRWTSFTDDFTHFKVCPFFNLPATGRGLDPGLTAAEMKRCIWVKPSMVCEVKFTEWTRDDRLRQPVFLGLREDKSASEVIREKAS
jgi:hypothetical protein